MIASLSLTRVTLSGSGTAKESGCSISKLSHVRVEHSSSAS